MYANCRGIKGKTDSFKEIVEKNKSRHHNSK